MPGKTINIRSRDGGEFDCYLVTPQTDDPVPAIVLASSVHGIDVDIRAIADEFAAHGFIAAAPDLCLAHGRRWTTRDHQVGYCNP
jgi:carboxymethylenebutenolidase